MRTFRKHVSIFTICSCLLLSLMMVFAAQTTVASAQENAAVVNIKNSQNGIALLSDFDVYNTDWTISGSDPKKLSVSNLTDIKYIPNCNYFIINPK